MASPSPGAEVGGVGFLICSTGKERGSGAAPGPGLPPGARPRRQDPGPSCTSHTMEFPDLGAHCSDPSCKRLGEKLRWVVMGLVLAQGTPMGQVDWQACLFRVP
ncbi:UNVERIFIED_CONTAM: hypothetical protein K2H54_012337 [Gekko kuhli]